MPRPDRLLDALALTAVGACGIAGAAPALTITSGALVLLGLQLDARFAERHGITLGLTRAWTMAIAASGAGAVVRCAAAFAVGALVRALA